ncbi:major facilitator superfamily domain-containing protein [Penicillium atrosanguineum]|nr:major facilitator superfamily domain-containing protein [Penicillium atrosanguineum]
MTAPKPEIVHLESGASVADEFAGPSDPKLAMMKSSVADDALQMAIDSQGETWTEEEERAVVRKIDLVILPLLFLGSLVGYADSQAYGFAALFGLVEDLGLFIAKVVDGKIVLDTTKYQLSAGMTSLGGAAGQYLLLLPAQLLPSGVVYGLIQFYIGTLALLTIVCKDTAQIMALRWKTAEQPLRIGVIIAGNAVGSLVGNGVDFGALNIAGTFAASRWKWIYVILGSCALFSGTLIILALPATPMKAWFLSPRERLIAVSRLMKNQTGIHTRKFKLRQGLSTFLDPQVYLLCIFSFTFSFSNVAVSSFGGFLVTSFGYSQRRALVLFMPASAIALACIVAAGFLGSRFPRHRIVIAILFILPSLLGNVLLWKMRRDNKSGLLAGLYIHYSLLAANIAGHSKKTVVMGTITVMAALGGFSGPWAYQGNQAAQGYLDGQISTLCLFCASIAAYIALWFYYTYTNEKKSARVENGPNQDADPMLAFMDLTDKENPQFQYTR